MVSNSKVTCKHEHSTKASDLSINSCPDSCFRSPDVDLDIARDEIARAHRLAPEVVPLNPPDDAISHIIGIRPSRKGGFRLDSEVQGSRTVLSAYGFGGGGYAFSYGVADALVKMVEQTEHDHVIV